VCILLLELIMRCQASCVIDSKIFSFSLVLTIIAQEDSLPLGNYLLDGKSLGAHSKYYPSEWSNTLCRSHFRDSPSNLKRETFDEVCKHFSPALRFFFLEKFSFSTEAWHNARMRYIRSCAVSSMVGHLLGIGDRHLQNILICEKTGNLVHIDFGIVFEQGKCLSVPETVPFRLTRNIVDGMGPCGKSNQPQYVATLSFVSSSASLSLRIEILQNIAFLINFDTSFVTAFLYA
jgi:phosphatidylinositol kinase/protein kinase (PI-3  family)